MPPAKKKPRGFRPANVALNVDSDSEAEHQKGENDEEWLRELWQVHLIILC